MSGPSRVVLVALLLASFVAPVVQGAPVTSDIVVTGQLALDGAVSWSGQTAFADLTDEERFVAGPQETVLQLEASRADVHERISTTETYQLPLARVENEAHVDERDTTVYDLTHGQIAFGEAARVMILGGDLQATAGEGRLQMAREAAAFVDPNLADAGRQSHSSYLFGHTATDVAVLETPSARLNITGTFTLVFWDAVLTIAGNGQEHAFRAGASAGSTGAGGATEVEEERLVAATFHEATLRLASPGQVRLAGAAPTVSVIGTMQAAASEGTLKVAQDVLTLRGDHLAVEGETTLQPRLPQDQTFQRQPGNRLVEAYDSSRIVTQGEADAVYVANRLVEASIGGAIDPVAAGAAGLSALALAAALWRFGPLLGAALYSRLETGALLENTTRAQIYDIVCANPGINARGVHRLADASWGTVVHHLHKLRDAGYLAVHARGRAKCFYENHGKWDEDKEDIALLKSATTGQVAVAVAATEGRDQNQIVSRTGLPQSTVSYHLLKLEKAGLVSKERMGTAALVYYPTSRLRRVIGRLNDLDRLPDGTGPAMNGQAHGGAA